MFYACKIVLYFIVYRDDNFLFKCKISGCNFVLIVLVDECTNGTHNCDEQASCTNTDLSFTCACNAGYTGDGTNCTG